VLNRFPGLWLSSAICLVVGWGSVIIGIIIAVYTFSYQPSQVPGQLDTYASVAQYITAAAFFGPGLLLALAGELARVLLRIEDNTAQAAAALRAQLAKEGTAQP
jgi:hypothetical protein